MAVATFDTLRYANTLKKSGMPVDQAEAQANALAEIIQVNLKDVATKDDLKALEERLNIRFDSKFETNNLLVKNELAGFRTELASMRGEQFVIRWMLGFALALGVTILGLVIRLSLR